MKRSELRDAMEELGIDKENFRVLILLPLVLVAWADGHISLNERTYIQRLAKQKGWLTPSGKVLLAHWLSQPISPDMSALGLDVLKTLAAQKKGLGSSIPENMLEALLVYSKEVARASGGMFGLTDPISPEESAVMNTLVEEFGFDEIGGEVPHQRAPMAGEKRLLGVLPALQKNPIQALTRIHRKHGSLVRLNVPGKHVYLVTHPDHVKRVLVDNMRNYQRGKNYRGIGGLAGASLLTADGDEWRALRRMSQPAFHRSMMDQFLSSIVKTTQATLDRWETHVESGEPLDIQQEMLLLTLKIIGEMLFSENLAEEGKTLGEAALVLMDAITDLLMNPLQLPSTIPTQKNLRIQAALREFDRIIYAKIQERRSRESTNKDLLGILLEAKDPETGKQISDQQLRNELLTFLVAGHDTSASALTWLFYLSSRHPAETRRLHREVNDCLGTGQPTTESLRACTFVNAFIDESIRLYPSIPMFGRQAVAEDVVGHFTIERDAFVILAPWLSHRLPQFWRNPEGFDPERFITTPKSGRHPYAYYPFAAGPHKCIGMGFALMEMRTIVQMAFRRFRFELPPGFRPIVAYNFTIAPKEALSMTVHEASS